MAEQMDVHNFSVNLGTFLGASAGTIPLMPVSKYGGAVTLLSAHLHGAGTTTGTLNGVRLVYMTPVAGTGLGTPTIEGTLGSIIAATYVPSWSVVQGIPLDTAVVSPGTVGKWIGLQYTTGTILTGDLYLNISYVMGK